MKNYSELRLELESKYGDKRYLTKMIDAKLEEIDRLEVLISKTSILKRRTKKAYVNLRDEHIADMNEFIERRKNVEIEIRNIFDAITECLERQENN